MAFKDLLIPAEHETLLNNLLKEVEADVLMMDTLFLKDDLDEMEFCMHPAKDETEAGILKTFKQLVSLCGGSLKFNMSAGGMHVIKLVHSKEANVNTNDDLFLSTYITECVAQNKILDLKKYRANESHFPEVDPVQVLLGNATWEDAIRKSKSSACDVSDFSDDNEGYLPKIVAPSFRGTSRNQPYSNNEDRAILDYIIRKRYYSRVGGTSIWKRMADEKICGSRTWQSMKERYSKHIVPRIKQFKVGPIPESRILKVFTKEASFEILEIAHRNRFESRKPIKLQEESGLAEQTESAEKRASMLQTKKLEEKISPTIQSAEETGSAEKNKSGEQTKSAEENKLSEQTRSAEENKLAEQTRSAEENKLAEQTRSAEKNKSGEHTKSGGENKSAEQTRSPKKNKPKELTKSADENRSAEQTRSAELLQPFESTGSARQAKSGEHTEPMEQPEEHRLKTIDPFYVFSNNDVLESGCSAGTTNLDPDKEDNAGYRDHCMENRNCNLIQNGRDANDLSTNGILKKKNLEPPGFVSTLKSNEMENTEASLDLFNRFYCGDNCEDISNNIPLESTFIEELERRELDMLNIASTCKWKKISNTDTNAFGDDEKVGAPEENISRGLFTPEEVEVRSLLDTSKCTSLSESMDDTSSDIENISMKVNACVELPKFADLDDFLTESGDTSTRIPQISSLSKEKKVELAIDPTFVNKAIEEPGSSGSEKTIVFDFNMDNNDMDGDLSSEISLQISKGKKRESVPVICLDSDDEYETKPSINMNGEPHYNDAEAGPSFRLTKNGQPRNNDAEAGPSFRLTQNGQRKREKKDDKATLKEEDDSDDDLRLSASAWLKQKFYTEEDDLAILCHIYANKLFDNVGGKIIWEDMERKNILPGRSWHSLKERFRKRILPRLNSYKKLSRKVLDVFLMKVAGGNDKLPIKLGKTKGNLKYTPREDYNIIKFITDNRRYKEIKGKAMWESMSKCAPLKARTWESLKNRFLKVIVLSFDKYDLTQEQRLLFEKALKGKSKIRNNFAKPPRHRDRRLARNLEDSDSSSTSSCNSFKRSSKSIPGGNATKKARLDEPSQSELVRNKKSRNPRDAEGNDSSSSSASSAESKPETALEGRVYKNNRHYKQRSSEAGKRNSTTNPKILAEDSGSDSNSSSSEITDRVNEKSIYATNGIIREVKIHLQRVREIHTATTKAKRKDEYDYDDDSGSSSSSSGEINRLKKTQKEVCIGPRSRKMSHVVNERKNLFPSLYDTSSSSDEGHSESAQSVSTAEERERSPTCLPHQVVQHPSHINQNGRTNSPVKSSNARGKKMKLLPAFKACSSLYEETPAPTKTTTMTKRIKETKKWVTNSVVEDRIKNTQSIQPPLESKGGAKHESQTSIANNEPNSEENPLPIRNSLRKVQPPKATSSNSHKSTEQRRSPRKRISPNSREVKSPQVSRRHHRNVRLTRAKTHNWNKYESPDEEQAKRESTSALSKRLKRKLIKRKS